MNKGDWMRGDEIERRFGRKWKALAITVGVAVVLLAVMVISHYVGHA